MSVRCCLAFAFLYVLQLQSTEASKFAYDTSKEEYPRYSHIEVNDGTTIRFDGNVEKT